MNLAEAIAHAEAGGRVTCDGLPNGAVLKLEATGESWRDWQGDKLRVVFEATGDGFNFTDRLREQCEAMTWRKVEGWVSYG